MDFHIWEVEARTECMDPSPSCFHLQTAEGKTVHAGILSWCGSQSWVRLISVRFLLTFYLKSIKTPVIVRSLSRGLRDARILHMHESNLLMWDLNLKNLNRCFAPFWNVNSVRSSQAVHIWTARNIFQHVLGVRGSFWIFKKDVMQIVCFVRYPTSLVFAIVKPTQNKHTNIETSFGQKFSALYRDSHQNTSQLQSTTSVEVLYFLSVFATSIETFGSLIFQECSCLQPNIHFIWMMWNTNYVNNNS
jgi:hypothetical protein